ncbi:glucose-1-phosphate adenylyltransferase [Catenisphaera adipataccumulans]|uniref:Glucose-1-phosphate adenylyltransferase n=1 Tax=Catenisphaera adipataccumulans TaxID=700500 RepID=A0A7W8FXE2_9FIRM|nr:glucose-1-phosphate adenylyltransferase [Catenisphaera adipataccumulans]MBB5183625.1 glucose-1-phosphate adenylyltransferase [Catenisphaera adipataccumulans]
MEQNNMLAMILAGGRGTRLKELTKKNAKPAVYFGGKYRIIDFPLSNCANSDVNVVGVLTQYEPTQLNAYAGAGQRWGLDTRGSGVYVLPPSEKEGTKFDVYQGTADAITQNIDFIDQFDPDYVLVLSGDHIYKMDYAQMLAYHKEHNADATIAVLPVPMKEASRFGIMNTDENNRIVEFEEKPEHPKSNLASMGIYIFNWKLLRKELMDDKNKKDTHHDFGKDIIPSYLSQNKALYAWKFEGYWKDVGTIDSLWEANMDLLNKNNELNLDDKNWKIYTEDVPSFPHYVSPTGNVEHSYINQGAIISGNVKDSVLFNGVEVAEGADVQQSVLMPGVKVGKGAKVYRAIVAGNVKIDAEAVVGSLSSQEIELISKRVKKGE